MSANDMPPGADERTMLIPNPGGQRAAAAALPVSTVSPVSAMADALLPRPHGQGLNPLVRAASPLLDLTWPLRSLLQAPNLEMLRAQLMAAVRAFESDARAAQVDVETLAAARFALCTFVDEAISSTPWGGGVWGERSLLVAFHNESWGGEKFFTILQRLAQDARAHVEALELFYLCLALGMEGRYRIIEGGREQLASLRERLFGLIREKRGAPESELSPRWQGLDVQPRARAGRVPVWLAALAAGVMALSTQLLLSHWLNRESDPVFTAVLGAGAVSKAPAPLAPPSAAPLPPALPALSQLLAPELAQGLLTLREEPGRSVITLRGDGVFASGSSTIATAVEPVLARIGDALGKAPGAVVVIGHTDNQPPAISARLASNWELSKARAAAVARVLAERAGPPERYRLEGRGDTEPVASNATAAGRARNRRVDIEVLAPAGAP